MIRSLAAALGLLTILPVPAGLLRPALPPPGAMLWWWTPVGAVVGLVAAGVAALVAAAGAPWATCAVLGVVALAALSGGLHLDGFMDTCDGLGSRAPRERALEIMRDPHAGAFGVIGVVCLLLVKVAALAGLPPEMGLPALLLAPVAGRAVQVVTLAAFPYARTEPGMGGAYFAAARLGHGLVALGALTALAFVVAPSLALPVLAAVAACFLVAAGINRRLGGHTGDTVGGMSELAECALVVACLLLAGGV